MLGGELRCTKHELCDLVCAIAPGRLDRAGTGPVTSATFLTAWSHTRAGCARRPLSRPAFAIFDMKHLGVHAPMIIHRDHPHAGPWLARYSEAVRSWVPTMR